MLLYCITDNKMPASFHCTEYICSSFTPVIMMIESGSDSDSEHPLLISTGDTWGGGESSLDQSSLPPGINTVHSSVQSTASTNGSAVPIRVSHLLINNYVIIAQKSYFSLYTYNKLCSHTSIQQ